MKAATLSKHFLSSLFIVLFSSFMLSAYADPVSPGTPIIDIYQSNTAVSPGAAGQIVWTTSGAEGTTWQAFADGTDDNHLVYSSPQNRFVNGSTLLHLPQGGHNLYVKLCNGSACKTSTVPFHMRVGADPAFPPGPELPRIYYLSPVNLTTTPTLQFEWHLDYAANNTAEKWEAWIDGVKKYTSTTFDTNLVNSQSGSHDIDVSDLTAGNHTAVVKLCNGAQCIESTPYTFNATGNAPYRIPNPDTLIIRSLILDPTDSQNRTVQLTVQADWNNATNIIKGSSWVFTDLNQDTQTTVNFTSTNFNNDNPQQQTGAVTQILNGAGTHVLTVKLCNVTACSAASVSRQIVLPALPVPGVPVISRPTQNATFTDGKLSIQWAVNNAQDAGGSYWQLRNSSSEDASGTSLISTGLGSFNFAADQNGKSGSADNIAVLNGAYKLFVRLCNANNVCKDSIPVVAVTVSGGSDVQPVIIGYYSNWATYNNYLRHGSTQKDAPYGLSGTMYQQLNTDGQPAGNPVRMTMNEDADHEVANLDFINYAFLEAYPANSVSYDVGTGVWSPMKGCDPKYGLNPHAPDLNHPCLGGDGTEMSVTINDGTHGTRDDRGKVFFFDPWSDLIFQGEDSSGKICDPNAVNNPSDPYARIRCLQGYENGKKFFAQKMNVANDPTNAVHVPIASSNITTPDVYQWYFALGNFNKFATLNTDIPRASKIKRLISFGGWGHEDSFEMGAFIRPDNFVNSLLPIIKYYHLDGIDLDYEPGSSNRNFYQTENAVKLVALATAVRNAFNADSELRTKKMYITAAVYADAQKMAAFNGNGGTQGNWSQLAAQLDYIGVMGYDFHGDFDNGDDGTNLQSNLYNTPEKPNDFSTDKAVQTLVNYGVPRNKIIVGVPSYARIETGATSTTNHGLYQTFTNPQSLGDLDVGQQSYYGIVHSTNVYDTTSKQYVTRPSWLEGGYSSHVLGNATNQPYGSWIFNPSASVFGSYDTVSVVQTKAQYTKDQHLAGMMMWEMISDTPPGDPTSLLCAMADILHTGGCVR